MKRVNEKTSFVGNGMLEKRISFKQNKRGGIMKKGIVIAFGLALFIAGSVFIIPRQGLCVPLWHTEGSANLNQGFNILQYMDQTGHLLSMKTEQLKHWSGKVGEFYRGGEYGKLFGSLPEGVALGNDVLNSAKKAINDVMVLERNGIIDSETAKDWQQSLQAVYDPVRKLLKEDLAAGLAVVKNIEKDEEAARFLLKRAETAKTAEEIAGVTALSTAKATESTLRLSQQFARFTMAFDAQVEAAQQKDEAKQTRHTNAFTPTEGEGNEEFHTRSSLNIWKK